MKIIFALAVLALTCNAIAPRHYRLPTENDELNDRPIVGVFAYPSEFNATYPSAQYSYIAASYVKWVEQSGARVMPIPFDLSDVELKSMFSKINGVLFPGYKSFLLSFLVVSGTSMKIKTTSRDLLISQLPLREFWTSPLKPTTMVITSPSTVSNLVCN
jgi:Peptidase C26